MTTTTWDDVRKATAALDAAAAAYDQNPGDGTSELWEAARDALEATLKAYKAGRTA